MCLGATFLVFTLLVALSGPMLLQVNNILWEMGFSSLTEHCLWSSFHLANFCSKGWTKSRKLNLFLAALLKIKLFPSKGRRKPSCPSDHIWAKWPAGLGGTWVLPWGSRWEIFFHGFVQCLYLVMGLLQCALDTQMAKQKLKVWPCFTVPLGFFSILLVSTSVQSHSCAKVGYFSVWCYSSHFQSWSCIAGLTVLMFCRYLKHTRTAGNLFLFITKLTFFLSIHWILDSQNHSYVQAQVHVIEAPSQRGLINTFINDMLEVSAWPPRAQLAPKKCRSICFPK